MKEFDEYDIVEETKDESPSELIPLMKKAIKSWKKILLWALIASVIGIVIGLSIPKTFTSRAVIAPEIMTRSSTGGLSSLASLAGINMNTMALTDAMHPDMYPAIINSTNFYVSLFDLPVSFEKRDSVVNTDLYDYMANYYKSPWWGYVLGLPHMAAAGVKSLFSKKEDEDEALGHAVIDTLRLTKEQERVVKSLSKSITATVEKRTYLLTIGVTMQDRDIAAQVANAVVDNLKEFVTNYRTEKAKENRDYYKDLYDQTRADYLAAQRAYTYYMDTHQGTMSKSAQVYQTQLQNEAQLRFQMFSQTAQNLQNAEAKVQLESPVLVVIQPGVAPHAGKPSKVKLAILFFILGAALCFGWICWRKE